jgi:lysozyme family protein
MKEDWERCIAFVLKMEGGETAENDPNDPGGLTKFGISQKAYPSLDVAALTLEQAKEIYRKDYWNAVHGDDLPFPLALVAFDCGVNQGTAEARRLLQMSLKVKVDGNVGPITVAAAAKAGTYEVKKFIAARLAHYTRIILNNPKLEVFAFNWSYRMIALAEETLQRQSKETI